MVTKKETAIFGGGCFWCTEAVFQRLRGVEAVMPGYAGGTVENPTYEQVCSGTTGHAEVIKIDFDPSQIAYQDLLTVFFASHDLTTLNRQGGDVGTQYRSVVFTTTPAQAEEAAKFIIDLNADKRGERVVTRVEPLTKFYEAENYHRDYYNNNKSQGYCQLVIDPKLQKLQERFAQLLKNNS